MRLSEAIRLGGMLGDRQIGEFTVTSFGTCAMGGALKAVGAIRENRTHYGPMDGLCELHFRPARHFLVECPTCTASLRTDLITIVIHLNDYHRWSREQIADWVQTVEPPPELPEATEAQEGTGDCEPTGDRRT